MSYYKKSASKGHKSPEKPKPVMDSAMEKFADMLIKRMEEMEKGNWKKGWTDGVSGGMPQNIRGRILGGSNAFFLYLHTSMEGYKMPVYMTFNQAKDLGLSVKKGESSVPVIFWDVSYVEILPEGETRKPEVLTWPDYNGLSLEDQAKYRRRSILRVYPEFNVDQTNLEEVNPKLYSTLMEKFKAPDMKADTEGMYCCPAFDHLLKEQDWVCPIKYDQKSSSAFYSPSRDDITIPMKSQFNVSDTPEGVYQDGMEWYSTTIHEMAHSTGSPKRLGRDMTGGFGSDSYGREELVAEMTAAVVGSTLGFSYRIMDNNTNYLKSWMSKIKEKPSFLLSVVTDVGKASNMILDKVNEHKIAINEKPILDASPLITEDDSKELRLAALENKAVTMIVKRVSDSSQRSFLPYQVEAIRDYVSAAEEMQGIKESSKDSRLSLLEGIFAKAEVQLKLDNIDDAWIADGKEETLDLADNVVREENGRGLGV